MWKVENIVGKGSSVGAVKSQDYVVKGQHKGNENNGLFDKDLTLYSIDSYFTASTTDSFWKHCGKRRNCL